MKRNTLLICICILFAACANDDSLDNFQRARALGNNTRTYDEALAVAQRAAGYIDGWNNASSSSRRRVKAKCDNQVICSSETRTSEDGLDTLMYIFNYEDNKGFAIVSANKATEELLAVTEEGNYTEDSAETDETGLNFFIELAEKYVKNKETPNRLDPIPFYHEEIMHLSVNNLISVKWGQTFPEGNYCPNGYSGCAVTAIAQIMSYYEFPQSINLTYPNADMSTQSFDWDDMKNHILYYNVGGNESPLYCSATDSAHNAIGRLCRQLGSLFNATYNTTGTGVSPTVIRQPLLNMGYNCDTLISYTAGTSFIKLNQNRPLFLCGYTTDYEGHAWVVDGYESTITDRTYADGHTEHFQTTYNHVNWGWKGRNNGYYLDNVFDTTNYHSLDSGPYPATASYDFSNNVKYYVPYI